MPRYNKNSSRKYYSKEELSEDITFYRPDGDTEGKSIDWCLSHGFFEIEEGYWSGNWYYEHFPEEKKKKDDINNNKKRKSTQEMYEEIERRHKKERRAELLDTIYGGDCMPYEINAAKLELARIDGTEVKCPVCQKTFIDQDAVDWHVQTQTGRGHDGYREKNQIDFLIGKPPGHGYATTGGKRVSRKKSSSSSKIASTVTPPKSSKNQADIRSFFKPKPKNL